MSLRVSVCVCVCVCLGLRVCVCGPARQSLNIPAIDFFLLLSPCLLNDERDEKEEVTSAAEQWPQLLMASVHCAHRRGDSSNVSLNINMSQKQEVHMNTPQTERISSAATANNFVEETS